MQGKMKQNSRGFWWPAMLAIATSTACGAPPAATEPPSSPPPPDASAKTAAKAAPATQTVELVTAHVTAADVGIASFVYSLPFALFMLHAGLAAGHRLGVASAGERHEASKPR